MAEIEDPIREVMDLRLMIWTWRKNPARQAGGFAAELSRRHRIQITNDPVDCRRIDVRADEEGVMVSFAHILDGGLREMELRNWLAP